MVDYPSLQNISVCEAAGEGATLCEVSGVLLSEMPPRVQQLISAHPRYLPGVPQYWLHFVFQHFLGLWSMYRGTSDLFSTALEICYMIATRISKIDLEIA